MLPEKEIYAILSELDGRAGIYVEDLTTGDVFAVNPDRVFPSASVIKIPLHAAVLRDVEAGKIALDDQVEIAPRNRVGGTGIIKELDLSYKPTVRDLCTLMIVLSDNIATNQLMDMVGMENVNALSTELGLKNTILQRKMMDQEAARSGRDNFTTAGDMGLILKLLYEGKVVSAEASAAIVSTMKQQQLRSKLPALLPAVPAYDPGIGNKEVEPGRVVVAHKTGDLFHLQHDVGIFYLTNKAYVVAALTNQLSSDAAGVKAINDISLAVFTALSQEAQDKE